MRTVTLARVKAKTIASLGLSTRMVTVLIGLVHPGPKYPRKEDSGSYQEREAKHEAALKEYYKEDEAHKKTLKTLRFTVTVSEVIQAVECERGACPPKFFEKLRQMGLTENEWPYLAQGYAAVQWALLQRAALQGKEELLNQPIRFFGGSTVSDALIKKLTGRLDNDRSVRFDPSKITIRDLLQIDCSNNEYWWGSSVVSLRKKMRELGLEYEDGVFMQFWSRRKKVEEIMLTLGLSRRRAEKFLADVHKAGWTSRFID